VVQLPDVCGDRFNLVALSGGFDPRGFIWNRRVWSLSLSFGTPAVIVATISSYLPVLCSHGFAAFFTRRGQFCPPAPAPAFPWQREQALALNSESPSVIMAGVTPQA